MLMGAYMFNRIFIAVLICVPLLITGCESRVFSKKPVTSTRVVANEDEALFTAVTIETDRRILIIDEKDKTICGDPFTDNAEGYSAQFAESMAKAIQKGKIDAEAAARIASMYGNAADNISPTSQGLKFSRDKLYFLCISRQNAFITNEEYLTLFKEVINQSARLVALEIPTLRSANAAQVEQMRDYLVTSMETSADIAEAFSEYVDKEDARKDDAED
jgi:hypothetical protein